VTLTGGVIVHARGQVNQQKNCSRGDCRIPESCVRCADACWSDVSGRML